MTVATRITSCPACNVRLTHQTCPEAEHSSTTIECHGGKEPPCDHDVFCIEHPKPAYLPIRYKLVSLNS